MHPGPRGRPGAGPRWRCTASCLTRPLWTTAGSGNGPTAVALRRKWRPRRPRVVNTSVQFTSLHSSCPQIIQKCLFNLRTLNAMTIKQCFVN